MNYNLLVEPWIPVLWSDGDYGRVGIRTALMQAGRIRQIAASNPMDNVALLRLLLAVLQWCKPRLTDEDRERLEDAEGIPDDWVKSKLGTEDKHNPAFDLLRDAAPFYQDDQISGGQPVAAASLLHDLPSATNVAHFRHLRDGRDGMCLACCALGLVRWPAVASAGTAGPRQSMTASLNGQTPTYAVPTGTSLLQTLLLATPHGGDVEGDAPVWMGASEATPLGFLKGMTWRSRRVLLAPPDEHGRRDLSPGRCCYCGEDTDRLVRHILFRPGWKRPQEPWSDDPHLLQITRTGGGRGRGRARAVVPSWPGPNDALGEHAAVWRSVAEGLLQRAASLGTSATRFETTLVASSRALYKHAGRHTLALPQVGPGVAQRLLAEMEWLGQVTAATSSARGRKWQDPAKGHWIVGALCAPGAKGHGIRSGLCAISFLTEGELEDAFRRLVGSMAAADRTDAQAAETALVTWRHEVQQVLRLRVRQAVQLTTRGSPLRRREATGQADSAVREALLQTHGYAEGRQGSRP